MVRAVHFRMDSGRLQLCIQTSGSDKIVNTPSNVLLTCLEPVRPPGVDALFIWIKIAESICESGV